MERRPFVLSGGGIRGVAHFGVLRAFAEAGVLPSAISGTSAGALAGALVADGRSPQEAFALVRKALNWRRSIPRPLPVSKRIEAFLTEHLRHRTFEELHIPLFVSATDLEKGGQRIFSSGALIPALMASCAIPVVFPPVMVDGVHYVDGGISNNMPLEPFSAIKEQVVAVHVNPLPPFDPAKRSMTRTMDRVWHLNFREMVMRSVNGCGCFVEPAPLSDFGMFEFRNAVAIEEIGHAWTRRLLASAD